MTKETMSAKEANELQAQWMKLDANGPRSEIDRVCREYSKVPLSYISQSDSGQAQVMSQGMPTTAFNLTIPEAENFARKIGVQTTLRWNCKGQWFDVRSAQ